ncbi:MAG TPA: hypothetical protein VFM38_00230, partial [Candidatus Limnocylindrales bacterium]|nr:hypothetical protein [Candidatus Limnocylindrales bacterium]
MQSWPQQHDPRDPILDGRDSLRLVKLRLGLTLIAVAILPIAAVSPLVRAVAEEARVTHHERLADQAQTAAAAFEREVARIQSAERRLLDDPAIQAAADSKATADEQAVAYARLAAFVSGTRQEPANGEIIAAVLLNGTGIVS